MNLERPRRSGESGVVLVHVLVMAVLLVILATGVMKIVFSNHVLIAHVKTKAHAIEYRGKTLPVSPGMTATVDVLTGHKTVLTYLLKPLNKATENAFRER